VGGVEQHVEGLAHALHALGQRVEVYARTHGAGAQGTLVRDSGRPFPVTRVVYRWEDVDSLGSLYRQPLLDRAFRGFLAGRAFDVAHIHHFTGMSTGIVDELEAARIPSVLTLHDYWIMCPRGQMWHPRGERCAQVEPVRCAECLATTFGGWLPQGAGPALVDALHAQARAVLGRVSTLVVPSARVIPPFAALGIGAERFTVVENGVDTDALRAVPPVPPRAPGTPLRVGYLGTLLPSKGLDVLVDALQLLPRGAATLDIWGNTVPYHGDATFPSRVFGRLRPGDGVHYHGPYHTVDLPDMLARIDVVAAPALWHEAFGLTVREALAAGRPVVVSRVGGLQDAVRDGVEGLVVEPGHPGALAAALARLAGDPAAFARMATAARGRARGFAPMATELLALYRRRAGS
jgi:glycosyltransferase involved in cell wall biosynthesis